MRKHLLSLSFIAASFSGLMAQVPLFPSIAVNPASPTFTANDVAYLNKDTAVAVGNNGMTWRSTDGGMNWSVISTFTATGNNNAVIMKNNYICIAGDAGGVTFSNNKGVTWAVSAQAQPTVNYHGVHFADTTFGAAVGDNGDAVIYHWVGGLGWAHIPMTQTVTMNAVAAYKTSSSVFTDGNAIAVGNSGAVSTYAFGSWTDLTPPTTKNLNGVYLYPDNTTVLAVGEDGLIMKSIDYGNNWTTLNSTGHTLWDITDGPDANEFIAVGDSGTVFVSTDGGNTFNEFTDGFQGTNLRGVSAKDPKGAFAGTGNTLRIFQTDTLQLTYVSDTVLCPGDMFKVAINLRGLFGTGNSVSLLLSDSSGSFNSPTVIGTKLNPLMNDSVTGTIPMNAKPSILYQVLLESSNPDMYSDPNSITLTVNARPNNVTIVPAGTDMYVASQAGCTYQWFYNSTPMGGATDTIVTSVGNGNYYVIVTGSNGCTTTSNVFNYNMTGISATTVTGLSVGPNPASTNIRVKANDALLGRPFDMYDALGKKVFSAKMEKNRNDFDVSVLEPGIYFYTAGTYTGKIVISK